jgi:hypothetical protein
VIAMTDDRAERPAEVPRTAPPHVRHADSVETVVELERGRWAVDIVVVFPDGATRHRIDTFPTKARAEISARLIKRAAERELQGPLHG